MTTKSDIPDVGQIVDHAGYNCLKCGARMNRRTAVGEQTEEGKKHAPRVYPSICIMCLNLAIYDVELGTLREPTALESLYLDFDPGMRRLIAQTKRDIKQTWAIVNAIKDKVMDEKTKTS